MSPGKDSSSPTVICVESVLYRSDPTSFDLYHCGRAVDQRCFLEQAEKALIERWRGGRTCSGVACMSAVLPSQFRLRLTLLLLVVILVHRRLLYRRVGLVHRRRWSRSRS